MFPSNSKIPVILKNKSSIIRTFPEKNFPKSPEIPCRCASNTQIIHS